MSEIDERPKTQQIHQENLSSMGRRRFVQTLTALGFGGSAAHLTAEDVIAAGKREVPIVYGYTRDVDGDPSSMAPGKATVPRTTNVPADWYNDLQHAFNIHDRVSDQWLSMDGVVSTGVSPGEYGGENASIVVELLRNNASQNRGKIAESVRGVPIEIEEVNPGFPLGCVDEANYNDGDFGANVPGGVLCEGPSSSGKQKCATLAPPLFVDGVGANFVTANHVYGGQGTQHQGDPLYHPEKSSGDMVGTVERGHCYDDFIRIIPNADHDPIAGIEGADPDAVSGHFTKDGLSNLKGLDAKLRKWAITTGYTEGYINKVDAKTANYGCQYKDGQLKWGDGSVAEAGDSGSVNYYPDPEFPDSFIMVGGFNNWNTGSEVYGTGGWSIQNHHGFTF